MDKEKGKIPSQIGTYKILQKLPPQGMGLFYLGERGERKVWIKSIPSNMKVDQEFKDRFLREMEVVGRLNHPNIVQALDFGWDEKEKSYYLVYEKLEGESLGEGLNKVGKMAVPMVIRIALEVAKGLAHAHQQKIIHRYITPESIFLCEDGSIKITNFGLAKFTHTTSITMAGTLLGNPLYMSPEQAMSDYLDYRTDQYSLGITIFHAIAGEPPFDNPIPIRIIEAHCYNPLPSLKEKAPHIPDKVEALVNKLCAKNPDDRYEITEDVVLELEDILESLS
ncbi:MAG: serine/threonine protein kinase [Planctomycetota bacterium]|nr:MAG: serine/threonine protein kinase [Planctomycetota bacterium]